MNYDKIIIGAGLYGLYSAVYCGKKGEKILVLECDSQESENNAKNFLASYVTRCVVKSKTAQAGRVELNLEVRLKGDNTDFVTALSQLPGVRSAVLVSYNGEYMD